MTPQAPEQDEGPGPVIVIGPPPASASSTTPLLPPRPNLGPEPWREPIGVAPWLIAAAALVLLGAIGFGLRARRRRARRRSSGAAPARSSRGPGGPTSEADRLVDRAEAIREALIAAFGPSWAARTTEEVADAPELPDRIGPDRASRVVALLAEADRAKFAGGVPPGDQGEAAEADRWVAEVVEALAAAAGASSTTSGR